MYLVKCWSWSRDEVLNQLKQEVGRASVHYLPTDAFLVALSADQAREFAALEVVAGVYVMPPKMKRRGSAERSTSQQGTSSRSTSRNSTQTATSDQKERFVDVLLGVRGSDVKDRWQSELTAADLGCKDVKVHSTRRESVVVQLHTGCLLPVMEWLEHQGETIWVSEREPQQLKNRVRHKKLQDLLQANTSEHSRSLRALKVSEASSSAAGLRHKYAVPHVLGTSDIWLRKGLQGDNQIVGVADTGVDFDNCLLSDDLNAVGLCGKGRSPCSQSTLSRDHRKIISYRIIEGTFNIPGDQEGHGTHVAGSIAGVAPDSAPLEVRQSTGMAPQAKLAIDDLPYDGESLQVPIDLYDGLWQFPYDIGARIHSNSWGGISTDYELEAFIADQFMYDHPDFLIVVAAGNDGPTQQTVASPATAKNVLSVGASENAPQAYSESAAQYMRVERAPDQRTVGAWVYVVPAEFGVERSPSNPLQGDLIAMDPADGCSAATNSVTGKIVMVFRGTCLFHEKAINAMNSGAIALIVIQNNRWQGPLVMAEDDSLQSVNIPCVMIGRSEGGKLLEMSAEGRVEVTIPVTETGSLYTLAHFSSKGPTLDMRFKPDIVTVGDVITSAASDGDLTSDQCTAAAALVEASGTSMACPIAAGASAIVRQYFQEGFHVTGSINSAVGIKPSAALVKAMLVNSGSKLDYYSENYVQTESAGLPSFEQGFGSISLKSVLWFGDESSFNLFVRDKTSISDSQVVSYCFTIQSSQVPLKVSIVWTDVPAALPATKTLVNDLDLEVTSSSGTVLLGNSKTTPQQRDAVNNVEQVTVERPDTGTIYEVRIRGTDVPFGPQDVALVVTGDFSTTGACNSGDCPRACSGNGACSDGICQCIPTFTGPDCSSETPRLASGEASEWFVAQDQWQYFVWDQSDGTADWRLRFSASGLVGIFVAWNRLPTFNDFEYEAFTFDLDPGSNNVEAPLQQTRNIVELTSELPRTGDVSNSPGTWVVGIYGYCCSDSSGRLQVDYSETSASGIALGGTSAVIGGIAAVLSLLGLGIGYYCYTQSQTKAVGAPDIVIPPAVSAPTLSFSAAQPQGTLRGGSLMPNSNHFENSLESRGSASRQSVPTPPAAVAPPFAPPLQFPMFQQSSYHPQFHGSTLAYPYPRT